jgi:RNA polymerase sigma-32 factor
LQEGNVGLVIAAQRFDPSLGHFATYARFWIRSCMLAYLLRTRGAVRFGTTRTERRIFFSLGRACRKLEAEAGAFDREVLARELGVGAVALDAMAPRIWDGDFSLDAPARRLDRRSALADGGPSPEEQMEAAELAQRRHRQLVRAIARLGPRERMIIRARYLSQSQVTLHALGRRMGITRERVRQIEARAKLKLQRSMKPQAAAFRSEGSAA